MSASAADNIRQQLDLSAKCRPDSIELLATIDSTNSYLIGKPAPAPGHSLVVIANHQSAGRGRLDRSWVSPEGAGLWMSMAYTLERGPSSLSGLTLAIGIGVVRALRALGVEECGLKWPNDVIARDGKLGGILVESRSPSATRTTVVVGLGINIDTRAVEGQFAALNGIPVAELRRLLAEPPDRDALAVRMINTLGFTLTEFSADGFSGFHDDWPTYDWLRGKQIEADAAGELLSGVAQGIDADGALRLQTHAGMRHVASASVSVPLPGGAQH